MLTTKISLRLGQLLISTFALGAALTTSEAANAEIPLPPGFPSPALAADQPNITTTTIEYEGKQILELGHALAKTKTVEFKEKALAQAQRDLNRATALYKRRVMHEDEYRGFVNASDLAKYDLEIARKDVEVSLNVMKFQREIVIADGRGEDRRTDAAKIYQRTLELIAEGWNLRLARARADLGYRTFRYEMMKRLSETRDTSPDTLEKTLLERDEARIRVEAAEKEMEFSNFAIEASAKTLERLHSNP